jgi:hypothetical protein
MAKPLTTPERLFDRTWRPGHPFRPRISNTRRWFMSVVFFLLCIIIGGYWYITDSNRVREMAESALSRILHGHVKVEQATLSIFEGLRLDGVNFYVDASRSPDSLLFSAKSFIVQYNPQALLTGKIDPTRIIAVDPHVRIMEDITSGQRNYERLFENHTSPSSMTSPPMGANVQLPEISLRNAQVDYIRTEDGAAVESSSIAIEGQLTPMPADKVYTFSFQSRGRLAGIGPMISGQMEMDTGAVHASLQNFEFGPDLKSMLSPDVRDWLEQHGLSGRVNIPLLDYVPPTTPGGRPGYTVKLELQGVKLSVHPEEWMGAREHHILNDIRDTFQSLRIAGINRPFVDHIAAMAEAAPLNLRQVHGEFIFTGDETIQIPELNGWLEEMPFKISGRIKGYSPAAEAHIRLASSDLHDIEIPAAPRYVNSLPPAVREIYDRFRPRGVCRFWVELDREVAGARPTVSGEIEIIDGNFVFEKFAYPLRRATGRIVIGKNPQTGQEQLRLDHIRGKGVLGGPNAEATVEINGSIGPFGPDAAVAITVSAQNVTSEPAMIAAFPPLTQKALTMFDAPGKGEYPKFSGDFQCNIIRLGEVESHWLIDTDVKLRDASGMLVGFPYLMTGVNGDLKIHDDNIEIINVNMKRGDATMRIDGRVSWPGENAPRPAPGEPLLKPNLRVVAKDVPVDDALLDALPAGHRARLKKLGAGGKFDLEGTIKQGSSAGEDLDLDLRIALRDGVLWPMDGGYAVSDLEGGLRLTNQRLTLSDLRGKRGDADIAARGEISWPNDSPRIVIRAEAKKLALDKTLYRILPAEAQDAWNQVRPVGTVDASLNYSGGNPPGQRSAATQPSSSAGAFEVTLTPRQLSATPLAVPYRLDDLAGTVTILPERVILKDLSARHGDAKVRFTGTGTGTVGERAAWDFTLALDGALVDDDLRSAVPPAMSDLMKSIQLGGKINIEFSKLRVLSAQPAVAATAPSTRGASAPPDIDFAAQMTTADGSLDVGVPLTDVKGVVDVEGSSRAGKLSTLKGTIDIDSLTLAGRPVTKFHAELLKSAGDDRLTVGRMDATIARGSMSGQVDYYFPDVGPSHYAVDLKLMDADVRDLAGEAESDIRGSLSASLAVEGSYDQPNSRRGRGVVEVGGEKMMKIPLVLGLLQITNLALPITSPFTQGSASYSIEGSRVVFDRIELRSREMLMNGDGNLDFNSRQVRLNFVTDSANWIKLPFIGDLLESARHELLQIHVRGTLQEPKVTARSMNTLSTTVDEIVKGDAAPPRKKN